MANSLRRAGAALVAAALSTSCAAQVSPGPIDSTPGPPQAASTESSPISTDSRDTTRLAVPALINLSGPTNSDGSLGSGCDIQEDVELPDGAWFAFVRDVDVASSELIVDVACLYGVDSAAWEAYAQSLEDGETPVNYAVSNDVSLDVEVTVDEDAELYLEAHGWEPVGVDVAVDDAQQVIAERRSAGLWLVVEDGTVAVVVEPKFAPVDL